MPSLVTTISVPLSPFPPFISSFTLPVIGFDHRNGINLSYGESQFYVKSCINQSCIICELKSVEANFYEANALPLSQPASAKYMLLGKKGGSKCPGSRIGMFSSTVNHERSCKCFQDIFCCCKQSLKLLLDHPSIQCFYQLSVPNFQLFRLL